MAPPTAAAPAIAFCVAAATAAATAAAAEEARPFDGGGGGEAGWLAAWRVVTTGPSLGDLGDGSTSPETMETSGMVCMAV